MIRVGLVAFLLMTATASYSWNAVGHRIVAQIAYHHMTEEAKQIFNQYNHALDAPLKPKTIINSAAWLDFVPYWGEVPLKPMHYIDIPFSSDGTPLISPGESNAVSAIEEAEAVIQSSSATEVEKGFRLRILLHVIGDLHQPMHAANQFSMSHPHGDKGGNLLKLGSNSVATNLHAYWDRGGGLLLGKKAYEIEKNWPCSLSEMSLNPKTWAEESYRIAVNRAYSIKAGQIPSEQYQYETTVLTEQRIALAGCRLAAVLNKLSLSIASNTVH